MKHIDTIRRFSRSLDISLSYGGNSNTRVHMMERCIGGNLLEIPLSPEEDKFADDQPHCWKLYVEVMVKRARYDYERQWGWKPGETRWGKVAFHHWDHDELLKRVAEWLEAHEDHKTGQLAAWEDSHKRGNLMVASVKCDPIGCVAHYTSMKEYKDE